MSESLLKALLPEVQLTPTQKRRWEETLAAANWQVPGFMHILYTMLNKRGDAQVALFSEALPAIAATDGSQLCFKPSEYFEIPLLKRVFVLTHEIMHCVYGHLGNWKYRKDGVLRWEGRELPYIPEVANQIQDLIINDGLIESRVGEFYETGLHDPNVANHKDSWVEVYFRKVRIVKTPKGRKGQGRPCVEGIPGLDGEGNPEGSTRKPRKGKADLPGRGKGGFDQHLEPGTLENKKPEEMPPRNEQEWQQAVAGALAVARAQGKLPAAMEHMFNSLLEPKVDWTDHIRGLVARRVGSGGYDYRKPDRRLITRDIVIPGRSGFGVECVVIGCDSSGSIYADPGCIEQFFAECKGILEDLRPRRIYLVWCDAKVHRVDELVDPGDLESARVKGAIGGGGTDFRPVFRWVENNHLNPDCMLYLTDMMGKFPDSAPRYPVIWGSTTDLPAPFGDVVRIPYNPQG
jgi:predicted metal-dependent peptidase